MSQYGTSLAPTCYKACSHRIVQHGKIHHISSVDRSPAAPPRHDFRSWRRLIAGLEVVLDEPEGSAQKLMGLTGMNKLGLDLVAHIHDHHSFEASNVLPNFLVRYPQLSTAIDLLENDHHFIIQALVQSKQVFTQLHGDKLHGDKLHGDKLHGEQTTKAMIGKALERAEFLNKVLTRHTCDEEDILIPAVLNDHA